MWSSLTADNPAPTTLAKRRIRGAGVTFKKTPIRWITMTVGRVGGVVRGGGVSAARAPRVAPLGACARSGMVRVIAREPTEPEEHGSC